MATDTSTPPTRPKYLRYSLRTFLIVVTVFAIWLGSTVSRARTQRAAVETIMAAGGTIHYDFEEIKPRTWSSVGKPTGLQWLRDLLGPEFFDRPVYVRFSRPPRSPNWLEAINQLPTVRTLMLSGRNASDDTLRRLEPSSTLIELHLSGGTNNLSDDGLKQLAKFPRLRWLIMNHNQGITDVGVEQLRPLGSLQELILLQTSVSDGALTTIANSFPDLQEVDLRRTGVTAQGIETLRQQRPQLKVLQ